MQGGPNCDTKVLVVHFLTTTDRTTLLCSQISIIIFHSNRVRLHNTAQQILFWLFFFFVLHPTGYTFCSPERENLAPKCPGPASVPTGVREFVRGNHSFPRGWICISNSVPFRSIRVEEGAGEQGPWMYVAIRDLLVSPEFIPAHNTQNTTTNSKTHTHAEHRTIVKISNASSGTTPRTPSVNERHTKRNSTQRQHTHTHIGEKFCILRHKNLQSQSIDFVRASHWGPGLGGMVAPDGQGSFTIKS